MHDPSTANAANHAGPGYANAPPPRHIPLDDAMSEHIIRWLAFVPQSHRDAQSSAAATEQLERWAGRCREQPLRALAASHRHLRSTSAEVALRAMLLASEALLTLGHLQDASVAATAALTANPHSTQALWRGAVAHYRLGQFIQARNLLQQLVQSDAAFAPAWVLHGQTAVMLRPNDETAGRPEFEAAATLDAALWFVPVRLTPGAFQTQVESAMADLESRVSALDSGVPAISCLMIPTAAVISDCGDPDVSGYWWRPPAPGQQAGSLAEMRGYTGASRNDFAAGSRLELYQRNVENRSRNDAALRRELRSSVAALCEAALRVADDTGNAHGPAAADQHMARNQEQ